MQVSFVDQLIKTGSMAVHFMLCKDVAGNDCYFFLTASPQKLFALKGIEDGIFDLRDYGQIIASGFGRVPDAATKAELHEKYHIDVESLIKEEAYAAE